MTPHVRVRERPDPRCADVMTPDVVGCGTPDVGCGAGLIHAHLHYEADFLSSR